MNKTIFISIFFLIFFSCNNDKTDPEFSEPAGKIKLETVISSNPYLYKYYYYDKNENLVKIENVQNDIVTYKIEFKYNSNNLLKSQVQYLYQKYDGYIEYFYDEDNKLIRKTGPSTYTLLEYDENNNCIKETKYRNEDNSIIEQYLYEHNSNGEKFYETYKYFVMDGSIFVDYKLEYIYQNDLLVEKKVIESLTYEKGTFESLKYNNNNQLIERTQIYNRNDSDNTMQIISQFEYY
jgi:hypothetical protein